jgi:hypothetical protein
MKKFIISENPAIDLKEKIIKGDKGDTGLTGATGATGATGSSGSNFKTTSISSASITTGAVTITVGTSLSYTVGQSVTIAYNSTNYMVGSVTSYNSSTGSLQANITFIEGSGTYSAWQVNLAGQVQSPAGSSTQIQYNNSGSFAGSSLMTFNGSTLSVPAVNVGGVLDVTKTGLSGSTYTPQFNVATYESISSGTGFYIANAMVNTRTGGTGNRETLHVESISSGASAGEFICGVTSIGHVLTGSGNAFGLNGVGWVDATADLSAQCYGAEFNTLAERSVNVKIGVNVVDRSAYSGVVFDSGLWMAKYASSVGYQNGLMFGDPRGGTDAIDAQPVSAGGNIVVAYFPTFTLRAGIDLSGIQPTTKAAFMAPATGTGTSNGFFFGDSGQGGIVRSVTNSNGSAVTFINGGVFVQSAIDSTTSLFIGGPTKGARIGTNSVGATIDGVDNTGTASFQPLAISGLTLQFNTGSGASARAGIDSNGNFGIGTLSPSSLLTVAGPISLQAPNTVTSSTYSVVASDSSIIFASTNNTLTLPSAATYPGRILYVKNITANSVTSASSNVVPLASNAAGTAILTATAGKFAMLQSDGSDWITMMAN